MTPNVVAVIQARLGSERLPRKVLAPLGRSTVLDHVVEAVSGARGVDHVVLAVPEGDRDLVDIAETRGWDVVTGSEDDVLSRFMEAATRTAASSVIRLTADCPLLDPTIVGSVASAQANEEHDYRFIEGYPRGVGDVEALSTSALRRSHENATEPGHREHVVTYILDHPEDFDTVIDHAPPELRRPDLRVCVDTEEDLMLVRAVVDTLQVGGRPVSASEIVNVLDAHPELRMINAHVQQRE